MCSRHVCVRSAEARVPRSKQPARPRACACVPAAEDEGSDAPTLNKDSALELLGQLLGAEGVEGLQDAQWKVRSEASVHTMPACTR